MTTPQTSIDVFDAARKHVRDGAAIIDGELQNYKAGIEAAMSEPEGFASLSVSLRLEKVPDRFFKSVNNLFIVRVARYPELSYNQILSRTVEDVVATELLRRLLKGDDQALSRLIGGYGLSISVLTRRFHLSDDHAIKVQDIFRSIALVYDPLLGSFRQRLVGEVRGAVKKEREDGYIHEPFEGDKHGGISQPVPQRQECTRRVGPSRAELFRAICEVHLRTLACLQRPVHEILAYILIKECGASPALIATSTDSLRQLYSRCVSSYARRASIPENYVDNLLSELKHRGINDWEKPLGDFFRGKRGPAQSVSDWKYQTAEKLNTYIWSARVSYLETLFSPNRQPHKIIAFANLLLMGLRAKMFERSVTISECADSLIHRLSAKYQLDPSHKLYSHFIKASDRNREGNHAIADYDGGPIPWRDEVYAEMITDLLASPDIRLLFAFHSGYIFTPEENASANDSSQDDKNVNRSL